MVKTDFPLQTMPPEPDLFVKQRNCENLLNPMMHTILTELEKAHILLKLFKTNKQEKQWEMQLKTRTSLT